MLLCWFMFRLTDIMRWNTDETMSLVGQMIPLPVSRQYGNSYRGTSSQSAVTGD